MELEDLVGRIERALPLSWAEEWDSPGLSVDSGLDDVSCVAVALDPTEDAVVKAATVGAQLLFTHHPAIFRPLKRIDPRDPASAAIIAAIGDGVSLYSAHTNWDSAPNGVNATLASLLGLRKVEPLVPSSSGAWGMGAIGTLEYEISMKALVERAAIAWGATWSIIHTRADRSVSRVAICGGAGGDLLDAAISRGADAFLTADIRYHETLAAARSGIALAAFDHGEMERASLPALADLLRELAPEIKVKLLDSRLPLPTIYV